MKRFNWFARCFWDHGLEPPDYCRWWRLLAAGLSFSVTLGSSLISATRLPSFGTGTSPIASTGALEMPRNGAMRHFLPGRLPCSCFSKIYFNLIFCFFIYNKTHHRFVLLDVAHIDFVAAWSLVLFKVALHLCRVLAWLAMIFVHFLDFTFRFRFDASWK